MGGCAIPSRDRGMCARVLVLRVVSAVCLVAAFVVTNLSISGSSDSPCGSILDDRADWVTDSSCGIAHRGQLAVVIALGACGVGGIVVSGRIAAGAAARSVRLLTVPLLVGVIATAALVWRAATYEEPVLKRGWVAVRDLVAFSSVGVGFAVLVTAMAIAIDTRRLR